MVHDVGNEDFHAFEGGLSPHDLQGMLKSKMRCQGRACMGEEVEGYVPRTPVLGSTGGERTARVRCGQATKGSEGLTPLLKPSDGLNRPNTCVIPRQGILRGGKSGRN